MIARQYTLAQLGSGLFGPAFRARQRLLRRRLRLLVGVVRAVQRGEALEIRGAPGVLALQELVHFALRGGALGDGGGVGVLGGAEGCSRCADEFLSGCFSCCVRWLGERGGSEGGYLALRFPSSWPRCRSSLLDRSNACRR